MPPKPVARRKAGAPHKPTPNSPGSTPDVPRSSQPRRRARLSKALVEDSSVNDEESFSPVVAQQQQTPSKYAPKSPAKKRVPYRIEELDDEEEAQAEDEEEEEEEEELEPETDSELQYEVVRKSKRITAPAKLSTPSLPVSTTTHLFILVLTFALLETKRAPIHALISAGFELSITFPKSRVKCVPNNIFSIPTARFDHNAAYPSSKEQPVFTVWAVLNAIKNCSNKLLPSLDLSVRKAT